MAVRAGAKSALLILQQESPAKFKHLRLILDKK